MYNLPNFKEELKLLKIDKRDVNFLVTSSMVKEAEDMLGKHRETMDKFIDKMKSRKVDEIYFVACGSPLCACQTAQSLISKYSSIPAFSYSGLDFLSQTPYGLDENSVVIAISDSGNTKEVVGSVKLAKNKGALVLSLTKNPVGNLLADVSENLLAYEGECIWVIHMLATYYISLSYIQDKTNSPEPGKILKDLSKVPAALQVLLSTEEKSAELGKLASSFPFLYTVASGPMYPLAYKEGIITMLEFTWTHGSVINASEFRHGPLEVVDKDVPYVFLLGIDETREITERALNFVKKYSDNVFVFDAADYKLDLHPMLAPIYLFVPLEFFYYYLSINKDHNPDDRRYYGGLVEY